MRLLALVLSVVLLAPAPQAPTGQPEWNKVVKKVKNSIVRLEFNRKQEHPIFGDQGWVPSSCTAWAIRLETFVSAAHCGEGVEHKVTGRDIRVLFADKDLDLMVFSVPGLHLPPLALIEYEVDLGQPVMTLGYGYGELEPLLRLAYIAHPDMEYTGEKVRSITLDHSFIGGMSGSPVVDAFGHVITVATQSDAHSGWGRPTKDLRKALKKYL